MESSPFSLEIGGTSYGSEFQRTAVNTECKYLLFKHAFETLGCIRLQSKTDSRNERSQRAIERIGAVKESMLRNHMILPDGVIRHSVFYSILDSEWEGVKKRLEERLARRISFYVLSVCENYYAWEMTCVRRNYLAVCVTRAGEGMAKSSKQKKPRRENFLEAPQTPSLRCEICAALSIFALQPRDGGAKGSKSSCQ